MAEVISFNTMLREPEPGVWAGEVERVLPETIDHTQYIVERSASGLWSISLRGYNGGEPLDIQGGLGAGFWQGQDETKCQVVSPHNRFVAVPPESANEYQQAMTQPEARDNLLAQLLECRAEGVWDVRRSRAGEEYRAGGLLIVLPDGSLAFRRDTSVESDNDQVEPVTVDRVGPRFTLTFAEPGESWVVNSIRERTTREPTKVYLQRAVAEI